MRWQAVLALAAVAVAGCSDAPVVPAGLPTGEDGEALPTVQGVVVDEAVRPLAGANVRILGTDLVTTTDAEGRYEILRPTFTAESVLLTAHLPGYWPSTHQLQLSGHQSMRMDFRLEVDPYTLPHVEVAQQTDVLRCQARTPASGPDPMRCTPPTVTTEDPPPPPNVWVLGMTPGIAGAVVEVHWDAMTPASRELHAVLRGPVAGGFAGDLGTVLAEAQGPSPLRLEATAAQAAAFAPWTALHVEVSLPPGQPEAPASFAFDQVYEQFAALFYVDAAPAGYAFG